MKTYKHLFERMLDPDVVSACALDAAQGKIRRSDVSRAFFNFDKTYEEVVDCINNPNFIPCENNRHIIVDGSTQKLRDIEKPRFCPEQIIHHLLIEGFKPVLLNGLYEHVYGCLPPALKHTKTGKQFLKRFGPHAAIHRLRKWVQINKKVYVCEADIHHAYASVNIAVLAKQLERVIKDRKWLRLMYQFLHYNPMNPDSEETAGLTLGHYTSPWLFNFYLKEFDHFVAELDSDIKYLRFADNLFLVGPNKRKVHKALEAIKTYLRDNLHMELNSNAQVYRFEWFDKRRNKKRGRAVNSLGAIIHNDRCTLRKNILRHARRKALRIARKGRGYFATWHDGSSMFSLLAWLRFTQTYQYYLKYIRPNIIQYVLKAKIRSHSKRIAPYFKELRDIIDTELNWHLKGIKYRYSLTHPEFISSLVCCHEVDTTDGSLNGTDSVPSIPF